MPVPAVLDRWCGIIILECHIWLCSPAFSTLHNFLVVVRTARSMDHDVFESAQLVSGDEF